MLSRVQSSFTDKTDIFNRFGSWQFDGENVSAADTAVKLGEYGSSIIGYQGPIPVPPFYIGFPPNTDHDFLIRCGKKSSQDPSLTQCPGQGKIVLQFQAPGQTSWQDVDHINVDLEPLPRWMGIFTTLQSSADGGYSSDHDLPFSQVRPIDQVDPSQNPIVQQYPYLTTPPDNANMTFFVHGFAISEAAAVKYWIPTAFKRLYWVGHPVMPSQTDPSGSPAFFAGLVWGGDIGDTGHGSPLGFYPHNEFRSFETGVPIAKWLNSLKMPNGAVKTLNVLAHSMGNVVINSAFTRPSTEILPGTVDKYIAAEAAMPSEAFQGPGSPYFASTDTTKPNFLQWLVPHEQQLGYPDDGRWSAEWQQKSQADQNTWAGKACAGIGGTWSNNLCSGATIIAPQYQTRWSQVRPNGKSVPPDSDPLPAGSAPRRGPWLDFFSGNVPTFNPRSAVKEVFNTYSTTDSVLILWHIRHVWMQPYRLDTIGWLDVCYTYLNVNFVTCGSKHGDPPFPNFKTHEGATLDNNRNIVNDPYFWARLPNTTPNQFPLWADGADHWNILRQWAELSYWFPSLSGPAGLAPQPWAKANYDFTQWGGYSPIGDWVNNNNQLDSGSPDHSFHFIKTFPEIWCVQKQFKLILDGAQNDPDPLNCNVPVH